MCRYLLRLQLNNIFFAVYRQRYIERRCKGTAFFAFKTVFYVWQIVSVRLIEKIYWDSGMVFDTIQSG